MVSKVFSLFAAICGAVIIEMWGAGAGVAKFLLMVSGRVRFIRRVRNPRTGKEYLFHTPNRMTFWRAETFYSKEPETLEWLDSISPGSVLYDIGANVGLYTVYAGANANIGKVIAFEPEAGNYAILNRNILLNNIADRVSCFNIAVSDKKKMDYLYLGESEVGNALHSFGQISSTGRNSFKQGALAYSLDQFIAEFNPPFPTHIKVDVDGLEKNIVMGARVTLADTRLISLQIEIDEGLEEGAEIVKLVESAGLRMKHKKHSPMFDGGLYAKVYNYVFERPGK